MKAHSASWAKRAMRLKVNLRTFFVPHYPNGAREDLRDDRLPTTLNLLKLE
jgi:hypothetical protein